MLPGVPSVPDCTHSRGMSPCCRARSARCYMGIRCLLLAAMAVNVRSPSGLGVLGCRGRWDATCIDCGFGGEGDAGFGEAADCAVMAGRPNCPARNGGFFEYRVALLQGPRTLSRCLLEKVELGRLAAALAKTARVLTPAEDRDLRGRTSQSLSINHLATNSTCACLLAREPSR